MHGHKPPTTQFPLTVQKPEGGGRTAVIRSQKQLVQIAQEALLKVGKCQEFAPPSSFPSHCLMDNAGWLSRLTKHKRFQRGNKNLCGLQVWSCMLMAEVSFCLHGFSSLALNSWSSTVISGTRRQKPDAVGRCSAERSWSSYVLDYRMILSWLLLLRVHIENWAYK